MNRKTQKGRGDEVVNYYVAKKRNAQIIWQNTVTMQKLVARMNINRQREIVCNKQVTMYTHTLMLQCDEVEIIYAWKMENVLGNLPALTEVSVHI